MCKVQIEPRLREQEFGNTQSFDQMPVVQKERDRIGRFWFRFHDGESGADVYHRVASFWSDFVNQRDFVEPTDNVLLVTHGLTMRFLCAAIFHWSPDTLETMW